MTCKRLLCLCLAVFGLFLAGSETVRGEVAAVVVPPSDPVPAGGRMTLSILLTNDADRASAIVVPGGMTYRLASDSGTFSGALSPGSKDRRILIPPMGFWKGSYEIRLPTGIEGTVSVEIPEIGTNRSVFRIAPAVSGVAIPGETERPATEREEEKEIALGYFAKNFYGHEPMYFLLGADPANAKFQLSFKYRFINAGGALAAHWKGSDGLFFGYTQTSFWDLEAPSKPFDSTSYQPEFFYLKEKIKQNLWTGVTRFDFQAGLGHESNGRGGPDSRSLNIAYVRPAFFFGDPDRYRFSATPKIWAYVGDLDDNPDIAKYRGYFDLRLAYGKSDGLEITSNLRKGTEGSKGSLQVDVSYPLNRIGFRNLDFFIHGQYFTGYGENLLNYDRYDTRMRLGISIFR